MILDGKRILITGVVNRHSIAYGIAERAQRHGAEIVLTSFGRMRRRGIHCDRMGIRH